MNPEMKVLNWAKPKGTKVCHSGPSTGGICQACKLVPPESQNDKLSSATLGDDYEVLQEPGVWVYLRRSKGVDRASLCYKYRKKIIDSFLL